MKSQLINILGQADAAIGCDRSSDLSDNIGVMLTQLAGKVIVDKDHLRTLLLAVVADDINPLNNLCAARYLFPATNTIDTLLRQLNEEG